MQVLLKADARTRTGDPFITSEVLYQLSYVGVAWKATFEYSPATLESQIVRQRPGICSTGVPVLSGARNTVRPPLRRNASKSSTNSPTQASPCS